MIYKYTYHKETRKNEAQGHIRNINRIFEINFTF